MNTNIQHIEEHLLEHQGHQVLLDRDVAALYQVGTKEVNQAVKNNPNKFPKGYVIMLSPQEWEDLRSKVLTTNFSKTRVPPKAFTEKGLYMLATILKSKQATQTTILIIETFAKLRALQQTVTTASAATGDRKENLLKKSGALMADLLDQDLTETASETTVELNFAVLKLKHTTKRKNNNQ